MLGRVFWLLWIFLLIFICLGLLIARGSGGVKEQNTALLCWWRLEEVAVLLCRHTAWLRWSLGMCDLWGSSASIRYCGLSRGRSILLDPVCLHLNYAEELLGLAEFLPKLRRLRGQVLCQTVGTQAEVGLEAERKSLVQGWCWCAALVITFLTIRQVTSGWLSRHLWQEIPEASQRLEGSSLHGEKQCRHLGSLKEPARRGVIRPHDYLHVILPLGAVDPVLVVGEGGDSSELALPEAILKKHRKPSGQEVLGYGGHLQKVEGKGSIKECDLCLGY